MMNETALMASIAMSLFAGASAYAGARDVTTMKISNRLVLVLLIGFLVFAPLSGMEPTLIAVSMLVGAAILAAGFFLFALNWIGGGDAKFLAVAALWLGPHLTLPFLFYTALFGGAAALLLILLRLFPLPSRWQEWPWLVRLHAPGTGVPYAVPMAAAALLLLPQTQWASLLQ